MHLIGIRFFSLAATIKQARPELLSTVETHASPIASTMPEDFVKRNTDVIEGVGVPVTACFMTASNVDPTNWYMKEETS